MFQLTSRRNDIEINAVFLAGGRGESRASSENGRDGEERSHTFPHTFRTTGATDRRMSTYRGQCKLYSEGWFAQTRRLHVYVGRR